MNETQDGSSDQGSALVDVGIAVGQRPNGVHCVSLQFTTAGVSTFGVAFPPDVALKLAPQLAEELANAAKSAQEADRKAGIGGLTVVAGLPDSLRKG